MSVVRTPVEFVCRTVSQDCLHENEDERACRVQPQADVVSHAVRVRSAVKLGFDPTQDFGLAGQCYLSGLL